MKNHLIALLLLAASTASAQVSIGVRIGAPPPPRVVKVHPASPGPDYLWINGYWYPEGKKYKWHDGYWTRAPYAGARWVEPRHDGHQFFEGYWSGGKGDFRHDHGWDRDQDRRRDYDRHNDHH